ncbi:MAG: hypothetical protein H0T46_26830 [Deltaproteobacteria bacterium]|nr:hypothetical protein [Deltaproteobacteria bacterium]
MAVDLRVGMTQSPLALLEAGTHGCMTGSSIIIGVGGHFLDLRLDEHGRVNAQTLFNPFASRIPRAKVIERLATCTVAPVPASLADDLPALATALRKTRAEIIDAYVARIRSGMTISGGPTTDQSWTVSSNGTGFEIRSYAPADEGYELRIKPLAETALRTMLATYLMFGLADLPA